MGIFRKKPHGLDTLNADNALEFIQSKGMPARKDSDNSVIFKLNNEAFTIYVGEGRFSLSRTYNLDNEISDIALSRSNNEIMSDRYCLKAFVNVYREKDEDRKDIPSTILGRTLVFSCESLCGSYEEFKRQYEWAIYALTDGIAYHQSVYGRILQEMTDESDQSNRIGFKQDTSDDQSIESGTTTAHRKIGFS